MGWKDRYKESTVVKDGLFVKLDDQDQVDFILHPKGEPYESFSYFDEKKGESVEVERDHPLAEQKIILAIYVLEKKSGTRPAAVVNDTKLLRLTPKTFERFLDALDDPKYGGNNQIYRIKREGLKLKTKYIVSRLDRATDEQIRQARGTDLPDMDKYGDPMASSDEHDSTPASGAKPAAAEPSTPPVDDDIPF